MRKKTISNRIIRKLHPCYDPSEVVSDENEELLIVEWVEKYRNKVRSKEDIIWLLCNKIFMSDKDMRLFAVWCAREALKLIDNPDTRSINACYVAERYANGKATTEELFSAWNAARTAAWDALMDASRAAAWAAACDAARDASRAAAWASAWAATCDAAMAAAWNAERDKQIDQLLTYFK